MKLIKQNYEEGYHENVLYREAHKSQRNRARLELFTAEKPDGRLLEVGCGQCGFLRLARERYDVHGIDISRTAVDAAQQEFGDRVHVANLERDNLPQYAYDAVAVFNILEHLQDPAGAVQKLYGALDQGGVMIGSVPNNSGPVGSVVTVIANYFDRTHVSTYPPVQWRNIFQQAGFAQIEFFGEITIGRNRCTYMRSNAWEPLSFNLMFLCRK